MVVFGKTVGAIVCLIVLLALILFANKRKKDFVFVSCAVLTATMLCSPALGTSMHPQVLIFPPILFLVKRLSEVIRKKALLQEVHGGSA
jgi:hypothetical protein